jgi:cell division protein FtsI (penicillin-binding protein 3)
MRDAAHSSASPPDAPHALLRGRRRLLLASIGVAALLVVGRAVQLQGFEREEWRQRADEQHQTTVPLPARRGTIYDRDGVPLALTRETFRLALAPRELRDRDAAVERLAEVLAMSRDSARRVTDPSRPWVVVPGRVTADQRARLGDLRGLHWERKLDRFYPHGEAARDILGVISGDGRALGGLEQALDSVLSGRPGSAVLRRDARGRKEASATLPVVEATDGADVYLTIDLDLQEIVDGTLADAVARTNAAGGDLVLLDPRTGEILAAVSRRAGRSRGLGAFLEPYEPGSTIKPFFVATLLAGGVATMGEWIDIENGEWRDPFGRVHRDVGRHESLTLRDALRVSSNVGMVKLVDRLSRGRQYAYLRDFGFGTPTGVEYPAESGGRLPRPERWSNYTASSLATGYELSVTPLQLALGYAALANGGVLMEPRLVREVRGADGATLERRAPREVRRVVPRAVAAQIRDVLASAVDDGTATRASLATFQVAGKTGTARRTGSDGRYEAGAYTANFVGFFPARDPQLVILVKLDRPRGEYYGGLTAAPVTRETLQAILAAHAPGMERRTLLAARLPDPRGVATRGAPSAATPPPVSGAEGMYVFVSTDFAASDGPGAGGELAVPDVAGLPLRDAARRLHGAGLHVRVRGSGTASRTHPAAGEPAARGDTLVLFAEGR